MNTLTSIGDPPRGTSAHVLDGFYMPPYTPGYGYGTTFTSTSVPQLVDVKTVRTKAGYLGQIWYRQEIVWESAPQRTEVRSAQGC